MMEIGPPPRPAIPNAVSLKVTPLLKPQPKAKLGKDTPPSKVKVSIASSPMPYERRRKRPRIGTRFRRCCTTVLIRVWCIGGTRTGPDGKTMTEMGRRVGEFGCSTVGTVCIGSMLGRFPCRRWLAARRGASRFLSSSGTRSRRG